MKNTIICFLFLFPFFAAAQDTVTYNLRQCIEVAVKNNLNVQLSEFQAENNSARLQQARAANLPYASLYANQGVSRGKSINPYTNTFINQQVVTGQYGINAGLTLFNGFSTINATRQSAFTYQASKMDYEQAKMDLTINVILAYLQVLSNEEQLRQAASQVNVMNAQIDRLSVLDKNSSISPAVLFDTKGQLANDKLNYINVKSSLATSKITLSQLMNTNFPPQVKFEKVAVSEELKPYESAAPDVYNAALKSQPSIKAAEFRWMSAVKYQHSARGQLFPTLTLNASVGTNYSDAALNQKITGVSDNPTDSYVIINNAPAQVYAPQYNFVNEKISFNNQFRNNLNTYVGLGLQFPIFNSLRVKTQMDLARISKHQAEVQQSATTKVLRSSVEQAFNDLMASWERYKVLKEQVDNYGASYKIATSKFEKGALSTVDFVIAKSNNDKAKMNLIAAEYDYILKVKILDYYNGKMPF